MRHPQGRCVAEEGEALDAEGLQAPSLSRFSYFSQLSYFSYLSTLSVLSHFTSVAALSYLSHLYAISHFHEFPALTDPRLTIAPN